MYVNKIAPRPKFQLGTSSFLISGTQGTILSSQTFLRIKEPKDLHCMKSVQIGRFFWSVFSCIRRVFSSNTGKYGPEKTPYLDTFQAVLKQRTVYYQLDRGSLPKVFYRKLLRKRSRSTQENSCIVASFLVKFTCESTTLLKKETPAQVFFFEFFTKLSRTPFSQNTSKRLLLVGFNTCVKQYAFSFE